MYNPVRLHFGKGVTDNLGKSVRKYGKKVLFIYGGGSIIRTGIYEQIMKQLESIGAQVFEYQGIKSNPVVEDVDAAAKLGRENGVDVILAAGGGSVIDSAKIVSITIPVDHSGWEFMKGKATPQTSVPLIAVLTLAATGTEMNRFAVVQNTQTREKLGYGSIHTYPKESFLDPSYTLSVPLNYTSYGITDLIAHCLEAYFGAGEATLSDRFVFSIIREALDYGPALMADPGNYDLREKIMYAATNALNNLTSYGRKNGDWGVHSLGHVLSVLYDVPHGASLSIVYPAWLKLHLSRDYERIAWLGKNLFGTATGEETIVAFEAFFTSINSPVRLSEYGIDAAAKGEEIFNTLKSNRVGGNHHKLDEADYRVLIGLMS